MTETKPLTVSALAESVGGQVTGDGSLVIRSVASLDSAGENEIAYVEDEKLFTAASESKASCVIIPERADVTVRCAIEVKRPKLAFALIAKLLHPPIRRQPSIHRCFAVSRVRSNHRRQPWT